MSRSHGSLQKCFAVQATAAATIAFEYRLSLASIVCLPSSSLLLLPSPSFPPATLVYSFPFSRSPSLPVPSFFFLLPHYTYSPRNTCTYIARRVGLTTCSCSLNCRLRPSFCTLAMNGRLAVTLGAERDPGALLPERQKGEREKGLECASTRSHISEPRNERSDDEI